MYTFVKRWARITNQQQMVCYFSNIQARGYVLQLQDCGGARCNRQDGPGVVVEHWAMSQMIAGTE
jgi:hypothetical protein